MQRPIILAAGGTGGHVFPALALAEELQKRGEAVLLVTDKRAKDYAAQAKGLPIRVIRSGGRASGVKMLRSLIDNTIGMAQALGILLKYTPKAVVGFGGYPALPTMVGSALVALADPTREGKLMRTILHEQNALLGRTNRVIAKMKLTLLALSFADTKGIPPRTPTQVTGNPVRAAISALRLEPYVPPREALHVLVTGGSQGARVFSEVLPAAIARLTANERAKLRLTQQCRPAELEAARAAYAALDFPAELAPFFADMPQRLRAAHLVIARAGASTVAELAVAGRPGLLVPLPSSADDHQRLNAEAFAHAGAGWCVLQPEFTAEALAARLSELLAAPETLAEHAHAAHALGQPDAAVKLADAVLR